MKESYNDQLKINYHKLNRYLSFPKLWNGYDAKPISQRVVTFIKAVLPTLLVQPEIFPLADSSVQLEYNKDDGSYLELVVRDNKTIEVFIIDEKDQEIFYMMYNSDLKNMSNNINKLIRNFLKLQSLV